MEIWIIIVSLRDGFPIGLLGLTAIDNSEPISSQVVSLRYEQQSSWTGVSQAQDMVSQVGLSSQVYASVLGRVQVSQPRQAFLHLILWGFVQGGIGWTRRSQGIDFITCSQGNSQGSEEFRRCWDNFHSPQTGTWSLDSD